MSTVFGFIQLAARLGQSLDLALVLPSASQEVWLLGPGPAPQLAEPRAKQKYGAYLQIKNSNMATAAH